MLADVDTQVAAMKAADNVDDEDEDEDDKEQHQHQHQHQQYEQQQQQHQQQYRGVVGAGMGAGALPVGGGMGGGPWWSGQGATASHCSDPKIHAREVHPPPAPTAAEGVTHGCFGQATPAASRSSALSPPYGASDIQFAGPTISGHRFGSQPQSLCVGQVGADSRPGLSMQPPAASPCIFPRVQPRPIQVPMRNPNQSGVLVGEFSYLTPDSVLLQSSRERQGELNSRDYK
eukprot:381858-Rhodomonas_salina.2